MTDLRFRRVERVHVEWTISKPLDRREARLLDKVGKPLAVAVNVTERDATTLADVLHDRPAAL